MKYLIIFALAFSAWAQTVVNGSRTFLGTIDQSSAVQVIGKTGLLSAIPATCTQGALYFATDGLKGRKLYQCTSTNTWARTAYDQGASDPGTCAVGELFVNTTSGAVLKICSATNTWTAVSGGGGSLSVTTKGDLQTYDTAAARLPVGTDGQAIVADSTAGTGLKWQTRGRLATIGAQSAQALTGGTDVDFAGATFTIPANVMGANGCVRVVSSWAATGSTKTTKWSWGGTTWNAINGVAQVGPNHSTILICNLGATNSQSVLITTWNGSAGVTPTASTASIDTTSAVVLKMLANGTSSDTVTLKAMMYEVLP